MSTGAVTPFMPNGQTVALAVTSSSSTVSFPTCDAVLLYNAGSAVMFVAFGEVGQSTPALVATTTSAGTPGSMPIPAGAQMLVGTGWFGQGQNENQIAAISGTAGTLYITPGLGSQR